MEFLLEVLNLDSRSAQPRIEGWFIAISRFYLPDPTFHVIEYAHNHQHTHDTCDEIPICISIRHVCCLEHAAGTHRVHRHVHSVHVHSGDSLDTVQLCSM